jgi:uncharacterized protein YjbJ (UPF0337 family)
LTG